MSPGTAWSDTAEAGPIHRPSSDRTWWTTGNVAEAVPGVLTPLAYTFWTRPFERSVRGSYAEMGVISRAQGSKATDDPDETALGVVFGRAVLNVNLILSVGAGLPGTSAAEVGANVLGDSAADVRGLPPNAPARYPVVAARLPALAIRLKRRMESVTDDVMQLWRAVCAADAACAARMLPNIRDLFGTALTVQSHATFLSSAVYEPLAGLVGERTDLLADLLSGYGGMVEVGMLQELWEVAHGHRTLVDWLSRYGYLATYAGNPRSRSWREDPAPIQRLLATYRSVAESDAPVAVERRRVAARRDAEQKLLAGVPATKRPRIRFLLGLAAHFIPLREVGKNCYLRAVDAARAGIRTVGIDLAAREILSAPEDVWFLTWNELLGSRPPNVRDAIVDRRTQHAVFETMTIPDLFCGCPKPLPISVLETQPSPDTESVTLHGVPAGGGIAEGRARVITDPSAVDEALEPGEVLIAAATDPSWTTLFVGASAVVTDLGGALSHGAIVARELGLPCVTNVRTGTSVIRSGDTVRVDGNRGTVTRLAPPSSRAPDGSQQDFR